MTGIPLTSRTLVLKLHHSDKYLTDKYLTDKHLTDIILTD